MPYLLAAVGGLLLIIALGAESEPFPFARLLGILMIAAASLLFLTRQGKQKDHIR
ncbi:hypothetical protein [Alteribacter natronophilus]|uniref:hypothetical protein n=1 Tax=Alteribacter natronophilus TaxID=2583810 RepID=UPI001485FC0F|nr:hypothetical protein [Alteribacter natronophilus]